jgi:hypothetical protein
MHSTLFTVQLLSAARAVVGIPAIIEQRQTTCSPLELIIGMFPYVTPRILLTSIARGTTEPPNPTYGIVVGDPLFAATQKLIPNVTGYAVNVYSDLYNRKTLQR